MKIKGIIQQVDSNDYKLNGSGTFYLFCQYTGEDGKAHVTFCEIDEEYKNDFISGDEINIEIKPGVYEGERILADEYLVSHPQNRGAYLRNHVKVLFSLPWIGHLAEKLTGYTPDYVLNMNAPGDEQRLTRLSSCFRWLITGMLTLLCCFIAAPFTGEGFKYICLAILINILFVALSCLRFYFNRKK